MKREELIRSREYWITQIQINLFEVIDEYLNENNLTQSQFAEQMNVSKGYVSQILSGNFDHKISKYIDLLLACKKVPLIKTIDIDTYVGNDICRMGNNLYTEMVFEVEQSSYTTISGHKKHKENVNIYASRGNFIKSESKYLNN